MDPRLREILGGTVAVRALTLVWSMVVLVIDQRSGVLDDPTRAFGIVAVMIAWTAAGALLLRTDPRRLTVTPIVAFDVALALAVSAADGWVYDGVHPQSFGSAWPIAAVLAVGAIHGVVAGGTAGAAIGLAAVAGAAATGQTDGRWLALNGGVLLGAIAGIVAGYVADRLRRAESEIERARAREEFARDLHDGVLQTLAVIQRRSDDTDLVSLARQQDQQLRAFIGGTSPTTSGVDRVVSKAPPPSVDLVAALHQRAAEIGRRFDRQIRVVVIDAPTSADDRHAALAAAAGEAITNAAKHAESDNITVCVDREHGNVSVTVNDDGIGFDPLTITEGIGLSSSIRSRLLEIGGEADIDSRPGRGTEVVMTLPDTPPR